MVGPSKAGDQFGYVGELIDADWTPEEKPAEPIQPPRHEGQPAFPKPGIYFAMPEEEYHAIPAASNSHLKKMSISTMDAWADSWMNLDRPEQEEKPYFQFGKAIHAFVLEGEAVYLERYAVDLDFADYEDVNPIVHTEQIKEEIGRFTTTKPVTPKGTKQELIDQLAELGVRDGVTVNVDGSVAELKDRIRQFSEPTPVTPVRKVHEDDGEGNETTRPASKNDWITQLTALNPEVKIWDKMLSDHRAQHPNKEMISAKDDRRVRIAAKMIMADPEISQAIKGGWPEVSIFWHCKKTGLPMKSRLDMLKMRVIADLKSFSNKMGKPIRSAINTAIASLRYNMQHVVYVEAVMAARALIQEHGQAAVFHGDDAVDIKAIAKRDEWCMKWAKQDTPPAFLFIFQKTGIAPVTRGRIMPRNTLYSVTRSRIDELKRRWVECASTYGTDPWLDVEPISETEDEEIADYATDIGRIET